MCITEFISWELNSEHITDSISSRLILNDKQKKNCLIMTIIDQEIVRIKVRRSRYTVMVFSLKYIKGIFLKRTKRKEKHKILLSFFNYTHIKLIFQWIEIDIYYVRAWSRNTRLTSVFENQWILKWKTQKNNLWDSNSTMHWELKKYLIINEILLEFSFVSKLILNVYVCRIDYHRYLYFLSLV
jgi:hypothetical protein